MLVSGKGKTVPYFFVCGNFGQPTSGTQMLIVYGLLTSEKIPYMEHLGRG